MKDEIVHVRIPGKEYKELSRWAKEDQRPVPVSTLVRLIVLERLKQRTEEKTK